MSRRATYPLRAALELRAQAVDEAALALTSETSLLSAFEAEHAKVGNLLKEFQVQTESYRAAEEAKDTQGRSAAEATQAHAFLRGRALKESDLTELLNKARDAVKAQEQAVELARGRLSQARAEHKAVGKHQEGWESEQRRTKLAKDEAEADDLVSSRPTKNS